MLLAKAGVAPAIFLATFLAVVAGSVLIMRSTRQLEWRLNGRRVRPWPLGYPSLRTQIAATLPSTVAAAANALRLNVVVVAVVIYGLLFMSLASFVAIWALGR